MGTSVGTIKYKVVARKSPSEPDAALTYYAKAVQDRMVEFEDFVSHMADHNSPYSRGVIMGVLTDMLSCLQELVLDGKSVRLGELGLFSIGITGKTAATQKEWNTNLIEGVKLNVRNTKTWSNAELRKRCKFSELTPYNNGETETEEEEEETGEEGSDGPTIS